MFRVLPIICAAIFMQGCATTSFTTKLENPIERKIIKSDYFSSIDQVHNDYLSASIGDELFIMNRFVASSKEVVISIPPTGRKFPYDSIWSGTYKFNDGKSGDLIVYTTPQYYDGSIGVLLDDNDRLATEYPIVQVEGTRKGRRWKLTATDNFFTIPSENIDSWALRYGGNNDNKYIFEIVNKHESTSTDVLQTIYVNENKYRRGFVIRNVLIQGISTDNFGVIKYKITDILAPKT
ncbi:hypothetical protein L2755_20195 [Shewanella abyssi]|uniref:hypothetical protein n=1 Tax=Shewanella abyssi TaxID=311789 RepID=UPI00200DE137|nr:hypothetical protein [Shewanella abyssi]MCL1051925.1 hypothetical protein [Shewanella abyssi]